MIPRWAIFGLGSRVATIAKAIACDESPVIEWCINTHCPVSSKVVFPHGIPGVEFRNQIRTDIIGQLWDAKPDHDAMTDAVARIFPAMELPDCEPPELGVMFRGWRETGTDFADFMSLVRRERAATFGQVATLLDSRRTEILDAIGPRAIHQHSREMAHDLDRSPDDCRAYLAEWWRLLHCRLVVSNCPHSFVLWPRQFLTSADHP